MLGVRVSASILPVAMHHRHNLHVHIPEVVGDNCWAERASTARFTGARAWAVPLGKSCNLDRSATGEPSRACHSDRHGRQFRLQGSGMPGPSWYGDSHTFTAWSEGEKKLVSALGGIAAGGHFAVAGRSEGHEQGCKGVERRAEVKGGHTIVLMARTPQPHGQTSGHRG